MANHIDYTVEQRERIVYSSAAAYVSSQLKKLQETFLPDTIEGVEGEIQGKKEGPGPRPQLLPASRELPPDALMLLAEEFGKAFAAMHESIMVQTKDYTQTQQLTQTESQAVLQTANNAIDKEKQAALQEQIISDYEQSMAKTETIFF